MSYSLYDFLESENLPQIQLLTNKQDFKKIQVTSSSVQELPIYNFIQPHEIVLSTGAGFDKNPMCLKDIIQVAYDSHAAAVFFSFQTKVHIPENVISYANSVSFPVFLIPWELPFSRIQMEIMKSAYEYNQTEYLQVQMTLYNLYADEKPMDDSVRVISEFLDADIVIRNAFDETIASLTRHDLKESDEDFQVPIKLGGIQFGNMYIYNAVHIATLSLNMSLIEKYLAFPLSLWLNKQSIEDLTEFRLKNDYIRNLSIRNYDSYDEILQQGYQLGFDLSGPQVCIAMKVSIDHRSKNFLEHSKNFSRWVISTEKQLLHIAKSMHFTSMISNFNQEFTIFLRSNSETFYHDISKYIDACQEVILNQKAIQRCSWGISDVSSDTIDFSLLYQNALLALHYCRNDKSNSDRYYFKDTKKALIVSILSKSPAIQSNINSILGPLLTYDKASDIGLLETLCEYCKCSYNISETARNLHIHRQSLLYRIERIEYLTGMSLKNHDDLFVLECLSRVYIAF